MVQQCNLAGGCQMIRADNGIRGNTHSSWGSGGVRRAEGVAACQRVSDQRHLRSAVLIARVCWNLVSCTTCGDGAVMRAENRLIPRQSNRSKMASHLYVYLVGRAGLEPATNGLPTRMSQRYQ